MKNYRVWDSVTEIMYYPEDFKLVIDHGEPELHLQRKLGVVVAKENDIGKSAYLMQYTGLKDKNGVEIYEGDIVKWGHLNQWSREQPHRIAEVKFNPDIQFHSQVGVFNFGSFAYRDTTETDLEVIGNIYENPELLEEEE